MRTIIIKSKKYGIHKLLVDNDDYGYAISKNWTLTKGNKKENYTFYASNVKFKKIDGIRKRTHCYIHLKKYAAQIRVNYRHIYLGVFLEAKDAAKAYNEAAIKYFGKYSRLNNI